MAGTLARGEAERERRIRVILFGLGPIGSGIARLIASRPGLQIVGAVDLDPAKAGRDVGEVVGLGRQLGVPVSPDAQSVPGTGADIVAHATGSYVKSVYPQLEMIVRAGLNIVSTCEELAEPWAQNPQLADELDQLARQHGVTVLGTGVNPGFMMDTLPLALTAVCQQVRAVRVRRVVDASRRRRQLQEKVGTGLTPDEFRARASRREIRHVGLTESVALIARGLGWRLDRIEETIDPVIASAPVSTDYFEVQPGYVTGVQQFGYGIRDGRRVIALELKMSVDAGESVDEAWIEGEPDLHSRIEGVHGDLATAAVVVNAIPRVVGASPGLLTMADLPVVCAREGSGEGEGWRGVR